MSSHRDGEADDANISYPSPGAEGMDTGPFYGNGRDGTHDQHDHTEHHVDEHVHGQDDQGHLHTDADGSQHHVSRPANLEELQLAAQLGQGLAGTPIMPATDPNMSVDEANMRSIMPHPDGDHHQTPPYVHDTPTSDHMVQHAMQVPPLPHQYAMPDGIPPRKRSKVSRACDECRRKKIKCDAPSDTGDTPCSSCARSSIRCLFSRVPQKRGPSKGYIKELADRINSIESKLESEGGLSQDEIDKLFGSDRHRGSNGTGSEEPARKRPFSSISTGDFTTPMSNRQMPWGSEPRNIQPASGQSDGYATFNNSSLAPQPSEIKPDDTPSKTADATDMPMMDEGDVVDLNEDVLNDFLTTVQPLYPILAGSKERQQTLLAQSPQPVRSAFVAALSAVGQSSTGDVQHASNLLHEWESSDAPHTRAAEIVHAQSLLLLVIDADWRSGTTLPYLLSRAVALANSMKLWKSGGVDAMADADSDEALCVRIWWSLVLMDRWYAAGTGKPSQIPDHSVVVPAGLENTVGETCFYFIRMSKLLNRLSFVISNLQPGTSTTEAPMAAILNDYMENYREDLPAHMDAAAFPLIHLAYWHCKLLVTLLTPASTPTEMLWPTKELADLLIATPHLRSPLVNHFVSLATMSLASLSASDKTREDAVHLIKVAVEQEAGSHWDGVRDKLAELLRPSSSAEAAASQGLQHLADLATGNAADGEVAGIPSLATGYLEIS